MKDLLWPLLISGMIALSGCANAPATGAAPKELPAIVLSVDDKEKLKALQQELPSIEGFTVKAVKLAKDEVIRAISGGGFTLDLPGMIATGKAECLRAGDSLGSKALPEGLSPEMKGLLNEGKVGLIAAYAAYAESFDSISTFVTDMNPLAFFAYRKKYSQAQELFNSSTEKVQRIMTAAGV
jgi:hypothetical protein